MSGWQEEEASGRSAPLTRLWAPGWAWLSREEPDLSPVLYPSPHPSGLAASALFLNNGPVGVVRSCSRDSAPSLCLCFPFSSRLMEALSSGLGDAEVQQGRESPASSSLGSAPALSPAPAGCSVDLCLLLCHPDRGLVVEPQLAKERPVSQVWSMLAPRQAHGSSPTAVAVPVVLTLFPGSRGVSCLHLKRLTCQSSASAASGGNSDKNWTRRAGKPQCCPGRPSKSGVAGSPPGRLSRSPPCWTNWSQQISASHVLVNSPDNQLRWWSLRCSE